MKYQILRMDKEGTPPILRYGQPMTFEDPAAALAYSKRAAKQMEEKLCVKPVVDEAWRQREQKRFDKGEYRYLPWYASAWWMEGYPIWKDHYPHASLEKPGWIAYTKSVEDGTKDKQSLIRPGAYLSRYFTEHMANWGVREKFCVEEFMKMYGPIDVKFAETAEDIVKVYNHGVQTCLHKDKQWPKGIHPASVYAAGDLQVAYMGNIDGKVSARAIVWPEKKIHSRIYGDIARLTQGLQRLGYKWGPPIGARLKRIELHKPPKGETRIQGQFLLPYIDRKNERGGGHLSVIDKGDHLVICDYSAQGSHHAGGAEGYSGSYVPRADEYPHYECVKCGEEVTEIFEVRVMDPEDGNDAEHWCQDCTTEFAWQCHWTNFFFPDWMNSVKVSGNDWHPRYADMYAAKCEGNGKLYMKDDLIDVVYDDGTTKKLSPLFIDRNGGCFRSVITSRWFFNDRKTAINTGLFDRGYCGAQELRSHTFQCDSCDKYWLVRYRHQPYGDDILLCPECSAKENPKLSARRKEFDAARKQGRLPLIAAE